MNQEYETERQRAATARHEASQRQMMEQRHRQEARVHALHAAAQIYRGTGYQYDHEYTEKRVKSLADGLYAWLLRDETKPGEPT
jgi:hypothetical protein